MKLADLGEGDEYPLGLDLEDRAVYEDRVSTFVEWGMTLSDSRVVARSEGSKERVHALLRNGCPIETLKRIVV